MPFVGFGSRVTVNESLSYHTESKQNEASVNIEAVAEFEAESFLDLQLELSTGFTKALGIKTSNPYGKVKPDLQFKVTFNIELNPPKRGQWDMHIPRIYRKLGKLNASDVTGPWPAYPGLVIVFLMDQCPTFEWGMKTKEAIEKIINA